MSRQVVKYLKFLSILHIYINLIVAKNSNKYCSYISEIKRRSTLRQHNFSSILMLILCFVACNCNNKAERCVFDQDLFDRTGHGGRCIGCKQNTAGVNCEKCKDNFYRGSANEPCRVCNCNPTGSASLQCDSQGRCICKPGVTGEKCDRCLPNFFGFSQRGCRLVANI